MKQLLCLLLFVLGTAAVSAQTNISGTLLDTDGFPLPGATILAKGTSTGTVADLDGNYNANDGLNQLNITCPTIAAAMWAIRWRVNPAVERTALAVCTPT